MIFFVQIAQVFGRHAPDNGSGRDFGSGSDHRTSRHNRPLANLGFIQHNRTYSDQRIRTNAPAVNHRSMTDDDPLLNIEGYAIARVQNNAILNIRVWANPDRCNIASYADVMHDRAAVTDFEVAADIRRRRDVDIPADSRCFAFY